MAETERHIGSPEGRCPLNIETQIATLGVQLEAMKTSLEARMETTNSVRAEQISVLHSQMGKLIDIVRSDRESLAREFAEQLNSVKQEIHEQSAEFEEDLKELTEKLSKTSMQSAVNSRMLYWLVGLLSGGVSLLVAAGTAVLGWLRS